jgi:hypothetical protein
LREVRGAKDEPAELIDPGAPAGERPK